ncbi:glycoside hydrolase family 43 protein [Aeromonas sanarellii]|uniref:glycoside hydrolase family 43 protein n=1 Tax=Aeromonas sanarellii TaxID=633415 RepID=UPI0039896076
MFRILFTLFILVGAIMPAQARSTFTNPILSDGADPWVVRHDDGFYYYTQTTGNDITLWRTRDIADLEHAERKVVWMPAQGAVNGSHIWAPELHRLDGRWYLYFAASAGDMARQRMYVLQSEGDDPFGSYAFPQETDAGKISDASDKWAIDGTVLEYEGQRYFIWSGWEGDVNEQQRIYIARMASPWRLAGARIEISRPELAWERIGTPQVNEAPQVLLGPEGRLFLVYSASGSWTDDYCLGLLTLEGEDPMNPAHWRKQPEPVFSKDEGKEVYGPGHNGFFTDGAGQPWLIYHAAKFKGAGWNREIHMQPFHWDEQGLPLFGSPLGAGRPRTAPH